MMDFSLNCFIIVRQIPHPYAELTESLSPCDVFTITSPSHYTTVNHPPQRGFA